jgi:dihydrodipicolinate synthase/N-acetylneuraminate lyase
VEEHRGDGKRLPQGVWADLLTPRDPSGQVDLGALVRLARQAWAGGVEGVVVTGRAGEGATLSPGERREVWETVRAALPEEACVWVGIFPRLGEDPASTLGLAAELGAGGAVLFPRGVWPSPSFLEGWWQEVVHRSPLPLVLAVPALGWAEAADLAERVPSPHALPVAVGVRHVGVAMALAGLPVVALSDRAWPALASLGAQGLVSAWAGLWPKPVGAWARAWLKSPAQGARERRRHAALGLFPSRPQLLRAMAAEAGLCPGEPALARLPEEVRLPLRRALNALLWTEDPPAA